MLIFTRVYQPFFEVGELIVAFVALLLLVAAIALTLLSH